MNPFVQPHDAAFKDLVLLSKSYLPFVQGLNVEWEDLNSLR